MKLISLSRNAVRGGQLGRNDLVYMERAFDFNDKVAKDIMIDRTQLTVIDITQSVGDALDLYITFQVLRACRSWPTVIRIRSWATSLTTT